LRLGAPPHPCGARPALQGAGVFFPLDWLFLVIFFMHKPTVLFWRFHQSFLEHLVALHEIEVLTHLFGSGGRVFFPLSLLSK